MEEVGDVIFMRAVREIAHQCLQRMGAWKKAEMERPELASLSKVACVMSAPPIATCSNVRGNVTLGQDL